MKIIQHSIVWHASNIYLLLNYFRDVALLEISSVGTCSVLGGCSAPQLTRDCFTDSGVTKACIAPSPPRDFMIPPYDSSVFLILRRG